MTPDNRHTSSTHSDRLLSDYRQRYGLSSDPFRDDLDVPFFGGGQRRALLEKLQHLCQFSASLVAVLGEPGTGKTRLARELLESFEADDELCFLSVRPDSSATDVLTRIADSFSLLSDAQPSEGQLLASLRRFAQSADELDSLALVVIDDAHHLDEQTLGALLSLLQGQDAGGRRLHIVVFAEPRMANRLDQFQMHEVLIHDFYLEPFSLAEAADYLNFRMEAAGYIGPELFNDILVEPWWRKADGRLPVLHQAAHQWLLESVSPVPVPSGSRLPVVHMVAVAALLGILIMAFLYSGGDEPEPAEEGPETVLSLSEEPPPATVHIGEETPQPGAIPSPSRDEQETEMAEQPNGAEQKTRHALSDPLVPAPLQPGAEQSDPAPVEEAPQDAAQAAPEPKQPESDSREAVVQPPSLPEDEQVLLSWQPTDYTLQLLGASSERAVFDYMDRQPNSEQLLSYRTIRQGEPWFVVVAGRYSNIEDARQAIAKLPATQREAGPWPRGLKGIQEEIEKERGL